LLRKKLSFANDIIFDTLLNLAVALSFHDWMFGSK